MSVTCPYPSPVSPSSKEGGQEKREEPWPCPALGGPFHTRTISLKTGSPTAPFYTRANRVQKEGRALTSGKAWPQAFLLCLRSFPLRLGH